MKKTVIVLAFAALAIGDIASAAIAPVNLRQANQQRRIDAGKRSGKLSRAERDRLTAQQHHIARTEDRLRARHGGHLTGSDKARIHAMQRSADHSIRALKHNRHRGRTGIHL